MLQLFSKAFSFSARKTSSLAPLTQGVIAQSLYTPLYYNFGHSKQKIIVKYDDELRPFTINNLWDNDGARRTPKKIGRGVGTGKGKTSGKGHKGQRSRAGGSIRPAFEGGQTAITERLPKWGIKRQNHQRPIYLNLENIIYLVKHGRLNTENVVTMRDLYLAGAFKRARYGVKILARGAEKLDFPLKLEVSDASETAINAIKQNGGSVTCIYRTKLKMKEHLKPHMFSFPLEEPLPAKKTVENLEKIKERGAEVIYNIPNWKKKELEEDAKATQELKEAAFEFPVKRYEGMGKDKVRERKVPIQKHIDYGFSK